MGQKNFPYEEMRAISRLHLRLIWETGKLEANLDDEDALLVKIMRQHAEYEDLWGQLDQLTDEEIERDGVNPIIHIMAHQAVENQILANDPEVTGEAVAQLQLKGYSRHDAVHMVANEIMGEMFYMMKYRRPFDEKKFTRKVRRIVRNA